MVGYKNRNLWQITHHFPQDSEGIEDQGADMGSLFNLCPSQMVSRQQPQGQVTHKKSSGKAKWPHSTMVLRHKGHLDSALGCNSRCVYVSKIKLESMSHF